MMRKVLVCIKRIRTLKRRNSVDIRCRTGDFLNIRLAKKALVCIGTREYGNQK